MARIYTVGQVNSYIKNMFDSDVVLERICVSGEVSNCKYHSSGHIYFTLKDAEGTLSAIMFSRDKAGLKFRLENGQKIVVTGRVSVYPAQGSYQIYVSHIERVGSGDLHEKFLALKKELEEMGMFDARYKKPIPAYVRRVGIVTASTGAAIQDIINISTRRNPYVQLILYPAQVQGEGAAESIVRGIEYLDREGHVDVMIVGRGGGSIEDLWAFNEEIVARAVFECSTPVISAVGHETDFTIIDFVADLRAPTPSAAAELAVYDFSLLQSRLQEAGHRLTQLMLSQVDRARKNLNQMSRTLSAGSPERMLYEKRQRLDHLSERLEQDMSILMERRRSCLGSYAARLEALSPLKKLSGGYSYTALIDGDGKHPLSSVNGVTEGMIIEVNVTDGRLMAEITEIEAKKRGMA